MSREKILKENELVRKKMLYLFCGFISRNKKDLEYFYFICFKVFSSLKSE